MSEHESSVKQGRGWWRSVWFVLPLIVAWLVPLVVLYFVNPAVGKAEERSVAASQPELVPVGSRSNDLRSDVAVLVSYGRAATVTTRASGVVTSVEVAVGDKVKQCRSLFQVNARPVLSYRANSPLFRDLALKDKGADVSALAKYLVACGMLEDSAVSEEYTTQIEAGVKKLQKDILGVKDTGAFSLEYVAFVPKDVSIVKSVAVVIGQEIAPGAEVATVSGPPEAISLVAPDTGQAVVLDETQSYLLRVGDQSVAVASASIPDDQISPMYDFLTTAVTDGLMSTHQPADDGSGGATGEVTSQEYFNGASIGAEKVVETGAVPATAIYASLNGTTCVFTSNGGESYDPIPLDSVSLIRGELGSIGVPQDLIGKQVVRDPSALTEQVLATCG
ncbi:hypothetical protein GCM10010401_09800 [Rarobacter faecitabidus]|uniref:Multidrug efflux pump subunit AcrA (Membrane-fusion protein) n=1 Tax=Rarobacter faecitabidus TaxID=13243 RepID=A0A542ZA51_RARFA|nr:efflux RND transporter periplasmic adaptor subunit [Rarobacter faecitabidus]TQL57196.1 hypothetical protein FB461_2317 [Rarobacter faecitabidus]